MRATTPLEVKVVYTATARAREYAVGPGAARRGAALVIALNLAVAATMYYVTWWHVVPDMRITLIKHTPFPVPQDSLDRFAQMLVGPRSGTGRTEPAAESPPAAESARYTGATARTIMATVGVGWPVLMTIASCTLALAAGGGLGAQNGPGLRRWARWLTVGGALVLGVGAWSVWTTYGRAFPVSVDTAAAGAVAVVSFLAGAGFARAGRRLGLLAAVTLIGVSACSAAGLYLFEQCGARWVDGGSIRWCSGLFRVEPFSPAFLAIVFVVQSLYGWVLWPLSSRLDR